MFYAWAQRNPEIYVPAVDGDRALAHSVDCLDARNLSYTLWLYEPSHESQPWYDGWNLEDLSIYSRAPQARYVSLERDPENVHFGARGPVWKSRHRADAVTGTTSRRWRRAS